jgi:hypothetical protein
VSEDSEYESEEEEEEMTTSVFTRRQSSGRRGTLLRFLNKENFDKRK